MLRMALRRCAPAVRRICATPPLASRAATSPSSSFSTTVHGARTASGKGTKREQLVEFLAEIGVTGREATRLAASNNLKGFAISTLRVNYAGLIAILDVDDVLKAIVQNCSLLTSPPGTTSGSHKALVDALGAEGAAEAIRKNPGVLRSPGIKNTHKTLVGALGAEGAAVAIRKSANVLTARVATIEGAHKAVVSILGTEGAAEAIRKTPQVLRSPAATIEGAHKALVGVLGAKGAAEAIRKNPHALRVYADTIEGASEAIAEHLGHEGMLQAAANSPAVLLTRAASIYRTATSVKGLLGDFHGTDLLMEKPRLFRASATYIEGNFEILCDAFDQDSVSNAVRVRPHLLYDRAAAKKAVVDGKLVNGKLTTSS